MISALQKPRISQNDKSDHVSRKEISKVDSDANQIALTVTNKVAQVQLMECFSQILIFTTSQSSPTPVQSSVKSQTNVKPMALNIPCTNVKRGKQLTVAGGFSECTSLIQGRNAKQEIIGVNQTILPIRVSIVRLAPVRANLKYAVL